MFLSVLIKSLLNNNLLNFKGLYSHTHGNIEIERPIIAYHQGLEFEVNPMRNKQVRCELRGSIHRYFHGLHNGDDFTFENLLNVLDSFRSIFGINLYHSSINNIEFGVNVYLSFPVQVVLDSLICLNGIRFEKSSDSGIDYYQAKFSQHIVKLYDKGKQVKSGENIIRIEIKVTKMQYLHKKDIDIFNLIDLTNKIYLGNFGNLLDDIVRDIIFDELTIKKESLSNDDWLFYLEARSDKYWKMPKKKEFNNENKRYNCVRKQKARAQEKFQRLVDSHRLNQNWHKELIQKIHQKWTTLTHISAVYI